MNVSAELNSWGLSSYLTSYVVKIRLLEDLIECAQKCIIRPDATVERELALMRRLQQQTWEDIQYFLEERDKQRWRTWDNPRNLSYKKPQVTFEDQPYSEDVAALSKKSTKVSNALRMWIELLQDMDREMKIHVLMA